MTTEESVDSVEVVASALDACAEGQMTWDEFDIVKHDKHYHKKPPEEDAESLIRHMKRSGIDRYVSNAV